MTRIRRLTAAMVLLAGLLLSANAARAGGSGDGQGCANCPPPDYSPLRYWTPALARVYDCVHGPTLPMHAPNQHPEIVPTNYIIEFPCPAAFPAETLIPVPTPPTTSRFRY